MSRAESVRRRVARVAAACALVLTGAPAHSLTTIGFHDFVGGVGVTSYTEAGFEFTTDVWLYSADFAVVDPPALFLSHSSGTVTVERTSQRPFDALSIQVREISESSGPISILFTGELAAGGTVSTTFVTDGVCCSLGWETVVLPDDFRALRSLSWVRTGETSSPMVDDLVVEFPAIRFDAFVNGLSSYLEAGFVLDSTAGINASTIDPEPPAIYPASDVQPLRLRAEDGGLFDLHSLEVRELNDAMGPRELQFTGRKLDGSTVQATVVTDGVCCGGASVGYETAVLPETFRQLVEVEWLQSFAVVDTFEAELVPPANDDAGAAIALSPAGGEAHGTLVRATSDSTVTFGDSEETPDVWYALSPATDTTFVIDTCGTHDAEELDAGVDTVLTVHDALPATDANLVAGNEDAPDGTEPTACDGADDGEAADAALRVDVAGGTTVWIRVARAAGDDGRFVLHVPEPGGGLAGASALAALAALAARVRRPRA